MKEILYFRFVLLCGEYDKGISFICSHYHGIVFDRVYQSSFRVWGTGCYFVAVCVCGLPLFSCMLFSPVGNFMMAVSASSARFCIHFFFLACMLYLGPFCNKDISELEKKMSVLLTTLG